MKCSFLFALLLSFAVSGAWAQQNHFIYLQTDGKQAFYVKLDKKIYSSASSGYLILPKLKSGDYKLVVGFPKNEWPEQTIYCTVAEKDAGYLLKDFGEKGWGLFNYQSLAVTMAGNKGSEVATQNSTDPFTNLVSSVVNDPTIKQAPIASKEVSGKEVSNKEPIKESTTQTISVPTQVDSSQQNVAAVIEKPGDNKVVVDGTIAPLQSESKPDSALSFAAVEKAVIQKLGEINAAEGLQISYIDKYPTGIRDTVVAIFQTDTSLANSKVVVIPVETPTAVAGVAPEPVLEKDSISESAKSSVSPAKPEKFLPIEVANPNQSIAGNSVDSAVSSISGAKPAIPNSDCKVLATEEDFMKLRKKMAGAKDEDEMIVTARKVFKSKCFSTEQVKNLAVLFLADAGKYGFFDMAYPFVTDTFNFPALEKLLSDAYYISRFKAMIRH